jgi:hypothetical protein
MERKRKVKFLAIFFKMNLIKEIILAIDGIAIGLDGNMTGRILKINKGK